MTFYLLRKKVGQRNVRSRPANGKQMQKKYSRKLQRFINLDNVLDCVRKRQKQKNRVTVWTR